MPSANARRARRFPGLKPAAFFYLLVASPACAAGWKNVSLPFAKEIVVEVPAGAEPMMNGKEWFANAFSAAGRISPEAGFASSLPHNFELNPIGVAPYSKADSMARRIKDFAVGECYEESAESAHRCPPELVKVKEVRSALGPAWIADVTLKFRRGGEGEIEIPAFVVVLARKGKPFEGIVFRSLRGEIKQRLFTRLGLPADAVRR